MRYENSVNFIRLRIIKLLDVLTVSALFAAVWYGKLLNHIERPLTSAGAAVVPALFAALFYLLAHLYQGFLIQIHRKGELLYSQSIALVITNIFLYLIVSLLNGGPADVLFFFAGAAAQFLCCFAWTEIAARWYFRRFPARRTVVIWDEREGVEMLLDRHQMEGFFQVTGTWPVWQCMTKMDACLRGAEAVFLCDLHSHERNQIMKYCVPRGIDIFVFPRIGDVIMSGAERLHLMHLPVLKVGIYNPAPEYLLVKRVLDVVLSLAALLVLSPLLVIVALCVKLSDGGSVFYKQIRLTKNGKTFQLYKFRSMRMDAEREGAQLTEAGDDRITPVGRVIRAVRIDELPQLFNILRGDMSIVGPRPERPEIAAEYEKELPEFSLRLQVKAGLTGYAQVYGQYNTTPYDKLLMDLMYIAKPSLLEDLKLILVTIRILFLPESTEGIEQGARTAANRRFRGEKREI